ncbi:hypothetical protein FLP41_15840 [Paracoccus marcusii]|nr:hypothetical protein FLP41_15840 [Paracoccus marcusii]
MADAVDESVQNMKQFVAANAFEDIAGGAQAHRFYHVLWPL